MKMTVAGVVGHGAGVAFPVTHFCTVLVVDALFDDLSGCCSIRANIQTTGFIHRIAIADVVVCANTLSGPWPVFGVDTDTSSSPTYSVDNQDRPEVCRMPAYQAAGHSQCCHPDNHSLWHCLCYIEPRQLESAPRARSRYSFFIRLFVIESIKIRFYLIRQPKITLSSFAFYSKMLQSGFSAAG